MLINIIADTSASYKTDGKSNLQRNIIRSIMSAASKAKYAGCVLKFFKWSDSLQSVQILMSEPLNKLPRQIIIVSGALMSLLLCLKYVSGIFTKEAQNKIQDWRNLTSRHLSQY